LNIKIILEGMRLKTLPAAVIPVVVGFTYYFSIHENISYPYFFLCLGLSLSLQIATNFYNDAIDYLKGADTKRVGPSRITSQRNINYKYVFYLGHFFIFLSLLFGLPIILKGGFIFLILGLLSMFLAYGYTGGPFPLAYLGLGEIFVFIFFGLVATVGSFYLVAVNINLTIILLGSQIGLLSCLLIAINNYRDRFEDIKVNKNTLATKLSNDSYLTLIDFFLFFPYFISLYLFTFENMQYAFTLLSVSIAYKIRKRIRENINLEELNLALALAGKHLVAFGFLLTLAHVC